MSHVGYEISSEKFGGLQNQTSSNEEYYFADICQSNGFFANSSAQFELFPSDLSKSEFFMGNLGTGEKTFSPHLDFNSRLNLTAERVYSSFHEGFEDKFAKIET